MNDLFFTKYFMSSWAHLPSFLIACLVTLASIFIHFKEVLLKIENVGSFNF